ncbi:MULTISPECIES: DUF6904 family protein [Sphingobacterium]|uniref:DUF6904 family protein n=1 Tax=Sphingobacterium populi TaxID=1812824 RepID=A0ABW5UC77_9SPHI|nr:hypothetical protein [Sphingobacterium sp. CFCC 11742]
MIYLIHTKRGLGVEVWGTQDDLHDLYGTISQYFSNDKFYDRKGFDSRDKIISSFSYELRKAYQKNRLTREAGDYSYEQVTHYGFQCSWIHFIFVIHALRYNMRFAVCSKYDLAQILKLEYWLERAMREYDASGSTNLIPFISSNLSDECEHFYMCMRSANAEYFMLKPGKSSFRKIPELLRIAVAGTPEYDYYRQQLIKDKNTHLCDIDDLELQDDHINYDIKW